MIGKSLQLRLLAGAAIAIFAALVVAWAAMIYLFQNHLEVRVEDELRRDALQLVGGIFVAPNGSLVVQQEPGDPRFETPASGLYWQIVDGGETLRSRSLWDQMLEPSTDATAWEWNIRYADGPFGRRLFFVERLIQPAGARENVLVQMAVDEEEITAARADFGRALALFLFLLWIFLSSAAWIQVHLGLRPLTSLRDDLAALRRNATKRLEGNYPSEVEPLTHAINDLAGAREADLRRARQRSADLAHGMKTPLAALSAQSRVIRKGNADLGVMANNLDRAIAAAGAAVEAELARARAAASRHSDRTEKSRPKIIAERLISVLEHTEKGMRLDYDLALPEEFEISVSEEDLTELLGPLLENAVRFARRCVRVTGGNSAGAYRLSVEDDGPGMTEEEAAAATARGVRLDQVGNGHGLGLAIARELMDATGGTISLSASSLGGLEVELVWPVDAYP
jgi:signal transduction histidine kinase